MLDLGSGAGLDVILSAEAVGPTGIAWGLDMTDEMLALARANAAEAGVTERALPQGRDRGHPAAGRERRRRDLELRDQPLDRQARRLRASWRACSGPAVALGVSDIVAEDRLDAGRAGRARQLLRLHRRRALEGRVRADARGRRLRGRLGRVHSTRSADGMHGASDQGDEARERRAPKPLPLVGARRRLLLGAPRRGRTGRRARRSPRRSAARRGRSRASAGRRRRAPARRAHRVHRRAGDRAAEHRVEPDRAADRDRRRLADRPRVGGDGHDHEHQERGHHDLPEERLRVGARGERRADVGDVRRARRAGAPPRRSRPTSWAPQ